MKKALPLTVCCSPILGRGLSTEDATSAADRLKVLADPTRLQLLSLIAGAETGEACVCELTEPVGLSQPTVSHHLKVLHEAGFVERERRGTWAFYRVNAAAVQQLTELFALPPRKAAARAG